MDNAMGKICRSHVIGWTGSHADKVTRKSEGAKRSVGHSFERSMQSPCSSNSCFHFACPVSLRCFNCTNHTLFYCTSQKIDTKRHNSKELCSISHNWKTDTSCPTMSSRTRFYRRSCLPHYLKDGHYRSECTSSEILK